MPVNRPFCFHCTMRTFIILCSTVMMIASGTVQSLTISYQIDKKSQINQLHQISSALQENHLKNSNEEIFLQPRSGFQNESDDDFFEKIGEEDISENKENTDDKSNPQKKNEEKEEGKKLEKEQNKELEKGSKKTDQKDKPPEYYVSEPEEEEEEEEELEEEEEEEEDEEEEEEEEEEDEDFEESDQNTEDDQIIGKPDGKENSDKEDQNKNKTGIPEDNDNQRLSKEADEEDPVLETDLDDTDEEDEEEESEKPNTPEEAKKQAEDLEAPQSKKLEEQKPHPPKREPEEPPASIPPTPHGEGKKTAADPKKSDSKEGEPQKPAPDDRQEIFDQTPQSIGKLPAPPPASKLPGDTEKLADNFGSPEKEFSGVKKPLQQKIVEMKKLMQKKKDAYDTSIWILIKSKVKNIASAIINYIQRLSCNDILTKTLSNILSLIGNLGWFTIPTNLTCQMPVSEPLYSPRRRYK